MHHQRRLGMILLSVALLLLFTAGTLEAQQSPCPLGQGYWKNQAMWPVSQLTLGSQTYTQAELLILLNTPVEGDASLNLTHQLIAAKLNAVSGADVTSISGIITQADALLTAFPNKLPYLVDPSSVNGQAMVSLAGVLDVYNSGQLTVGCVPVLTPTFLPGTPTPVPATATPTATPADDDDDDNDLPVTIIIEGPVQTINVNIITIYDIDIEINVNDPVLTVIQVGDVVRVEGNADTRAGTIFIVAVNIIVVDVDVVIIDDSNVWRDDGSCANPPPPWAPANGWRRRCEGGGGNNNPGQGGGRGRGGDDDDD